MESSRDSGWRQELTRLVQFCACRKPTMTIWRMRDAPSLLAGIIARKSSGGQTDAWSRHHTERQGSGRTARTPRAATATQRSAGRGACVLAEPGRAALGPQQRRRLGAGPGRRRRRAEAGRGRQRPAGRHARRRTDRRVRLGAARRGAWASHGGAAGQRQLRAGGHAAGRRPHRVAHAASWRAAAGQARADHRCGRRCRHHRGAACGALRRAGDRGGRTVRNAPPG